MKKEYFDIKISVSFFREGKVFVAYSPALDISTSGKDFKEVKQRFDEVVQIFFDETLKRGTLDEALGELGWQKVKNNWEPPKVIAHETEIIKVPSLGAAACRN